MTSEQYTFAAQDRTFSVTVVRKKVKNINLHIRGDGSLFISASPRVPWEYIEAFLQKKSDLICRAVQKMQEQQKNSPFLTLSDGETLLITGKPYRLDVRLGLRNSIRRNQDTVFMELKEDTPQTRQKLYHQLLQRIGAPLFQTVSNECCPYLKNITSKNRSSNNESCALAGARACP